MKNRFLLTVACAALLAGQAAAQTVDDDVNLDGDGGETTELTAFDSLSRGNQKIAQALFDAQGQTSDGEPLEGSLSRDDIAWMKKEGTGWGRLFKDMQEQGYIDSDVKSLGQLVSGKYEAPVVETESGGDAALADAGGDGDGLVSETGGDGETVTAAADGTDGMTATDGEPSPHEGAFDRLSPGKQKIAQAIHDAQPQTPDGEAVEGSMTLDYIAAEKQDGTGWGKAFKEMQANDLIEGDAKSLGQLVSGKYEAPVVEPTEDGGTLSETATLDSGAGGDITATQTTTAAGKSGNTKVANLDTTSKSRGPVVITTANGGQISVGRGSKGKSGLDTSFDLDKATGKDAKVAVTTGAGDAGGGLNHGQGKKIGVSTAGGDLSGAGRGGGISVTTAAGSSVTTGGGAALGHTKAGGGGGNAGGGGKALGKAK